MWLVQCKTGRHLVLFYYRGTVSTSFLFESVIQEMSDLHREQSHPSAHLSCSLRFLELAHLFLSNSRLTRFNM